MKNQLQEISFTEEIKQGFIFFLLCSKRPIDEILNPNFTNQRVVFTSQFSGMTNEAFTYAVFEEIREKLVAIIRKSLTQTDKNLIFSFATGHPDWNSTDYSCFPAIKWKLLNIDRLKATNPIKYRESILRIEKLLADL